MISPDHCIGNRVKCPQNERFGGGGAVEGNFRQNSAWGHAVSGFWFQGFVLRIIPRRLRVDR